MFRVNHLLPRPCAPSAPLSMHADTLARQIITSGSRWRSTLDLRVDHEWIPGNFSAAGDPATSPHPNLNPFPTPNEFVPDLSAQRDAGLRTGRHALRQFRHQCPARGVLRHGIRSEAESGCPARGGPDHCRRLLRIHGQRPVQAGRMGVRSAKALQQAWINAEQIITGRDCLNWPRHCGYWLEGGQ